MEVRQDRAASTVEIIGDLVNDVRTLVRQELALARAEMRQEFGRIALAAALAAVAAGALGFAGIWVLVAITRGIAHVFQWPLAGVYFGVGVAVGLIGLVLLAVVWRQLHALKLLPQTRDVLREQVQRMQRLRRA